MVGDFLLEPPNFLGAKSYDASCDNPIELLLLSQQYNSLQRMKKKKKTILHLAKNRGS